MTRKHLLDDCLTIVGDMTMITGEIPVKDIMIIVAETLEIQEAAAEAPDTEVAIVGVPQVGVAVGTPEMHQAARGTVGRIHS